jgi:RNA 3'-terminal phosphate cyclase (ATP)
MPANRELLEINGALGEGGGQVLRSSLTLSILTGRSIFIRNIRLKRSKHGLQAQHLKSVDAAAAVSKAHVEGAALGATSLTFRPLEVRSGRYKFDIGTAGATSLVFQTIFLPLCSASAASSVIITGGTHVRWSPCYHCLELHWLPYMQRMGFNADIELISAGFYPQGGGRINTVVRPTSTISPLNLIGRGKLIRITGISAVANLNREIAERQKRQALGRLVSISGKLGRPEIQIKIHELPSPTKGTVLLLLAEFENGSACYYSLGELGKPAEQVADEAVDALLAFLDTEASLDQYMADQLLLPLSFAAGPSILHTSKITQHLLTNAEIIRLFLPIIISIDGDLGEPGIIRMDPQGSDCGAYNPAP